VGVTLFEREGEKKPLSRRVKPQGFALGNPAGCGFFYIQQEGLKMFLRRKVVVYTIIIYYYTVLK